MRQNKATSEASQKWARSGEHKAEFTAGDSRGVEGSGWWVDHSLFFTDVGLPMIGGGTGGFLPCSNLSSKAMDESCTLQACDRVSAALPCPSLTTRSHVYLDMPMLALPPQPFTSQYYRRQLLPLVCLTCHFWLFRMGLTSAEEGFIWWCVRVHRELGGRGCRSGTQEVVDVAQLAQPEAEIAGPGWVASSRTLDQSGMGTISSSVISMIGNGSIDGL